MVREMRAVEGTRRLNEPNRKDLPRLSKQDTSLYGGVPDLPRSAARLKEEVVLVAADRSRDPGLDYLPVIGTPNQIGSYQSPRARKDSVVVARCRPLLISRFSAAAAASHSDV